MSISKLNWTFQFDLRELDPIDMIKIKYSKLLNLLEFRTGNETNGISFKRKIPRTALSGQRREESFSIFREGNIEFDIDSDMIKINWIVKLYMLIFLSILFSSMSGLLSKIFLSLVWINSIAIGLITFIIIIGLGILTIFKSIKEINEICLIKDF